MIAGDNIIMGFGEKLLSRFWVLINFPLLAISKMLSYRALNQVEKVIFSENIQSILVS
jgi:hypothetical protein